MVNGNKYCGKCGAFIPAWSDECLACGEARGQRKERKRVESGEEINLNELVLNGAKMPRVRFGKYRLKDAYAGGASFETHPVGDATYGKLTISIIGEVV